MAKYPKTPFGSQSPFERNLRMKAEEVRQNELRGCGDPNCKMCNPKNGKGSPLASRSDPYYDDYAKIKEAFINSMNLEIKNRSSPVDTKYTEARKEVEDFIHPVSDSISWSAVIGNDAAKSALLEAIEHPIKYKELYEFYGMTPLKGCLLWGPPGCGKTMLAKAAAAALAKLHGKDAEILLINGTSLQSMWVGETEKQIRAFFEYARQYRHKHGHSLVIFIDEADAILPSRDSGARFEVSNVSTFLAEMDGLKENAAFIILATNRPETIDEALLRDGRCDRKIKIERPGFNEGREILQEQLLRAPLAESWRITEEGEGRLAQRLMDYIVHPSRHISELTATNGQESHQLALTLAHILNGALLVGVVGRAKSIAFRRDMASGTRTGIQWEDLTLAVDEIVKDNQGLRHDFAAAELVDMFLESRRAEQRKIMN